MLDFGLQIYHRVDIRFAFKHGGSIVERGSCRVKGKIVILFVYCLESLISLESVLFLLENGVSAHESPLIARKFGLNLWSSLLEPKFQLP